MLLSFPGRGASAVALAGAEGAICLGPPKLMNSLVPVRALGVLTVPLTHEACTTGPAESSDPAVPAAVPPIGSVPNRLILRLHNTKRAEWPYKSVAEFWQNFS